MNDVMPPDKVFLHPRMPLSRMRAWETLYGFKEFELPEKGGLLAHYYGRPVPNKGMTYSQATEVNNIIKKIVTGLLLCLKPSFHPLKNALVQSRRMFDYLYGPHYFHTRYYNDCSRELLQFTYTMMRKFFDFELSYGWGRIIAQLIEGENSYRFRAEDIASAIIYEDLLNNPRKELKRVQKIYLKRELSQGENAVAEKFLMVFRILRLLLLIPKVKRAFKFALQGSEFENFKLDKVDRYWSNRFTDYKYGGEPIEIRQLKQGFEIYGI